MLLVCAVILTPRLVPLCCLSVLSSCPLVLIPLDACLCWHPVPSSCPPLLLACAVILSPCPVPPCCLSVLSSCLLVLFPLAAYCPLVLSPLASAVLVLQEDLLPLIPCFTVLALFLSLALHLGKRCCRSSLFEHNGSSRHRPCEVAAE